jgi:hypothetical protein
LRESAIEKGRLEETAASLREKAERLKYELADARQAEIARGDTIAILQAQVVIYLLPFGTIKEMYLIDNNITNDMS